MCESLPPQRQSTPWGGRHLARWRRRPGSRSPRRRALQELPCRALRQVIITNIIVIIVVIIIVVIIVISEDRKNRHTHTRLATRTWSRPWVPRDQQRQAEVDEFEGRIRGKSFLALVLDSPWSGMEKRSHVGSVLTKDRPSSAL